MSPYIPKDQREAAAERPDTPGKVAFVALRAALAYVRDADNNGWPVNWDLLSDAHKGLVAAEREFYRRFLAPHEDKAIARNGDIFE